MNKKIMRIIDLLEIDEECKESLREEYLESPESIVSNELKAIADSERYDKTFTLTYGDQAENHAGMQKIGSLSARGFTLEDLKTAQKWFSDRKIKTEIIEINKVLAPNYSTDKAYLFIARGGLNSLLNDSEGADKYFREQDALEKDSKAFMYGRVVNKKARHNLCFSDQAQEPDYENKKGRIISLDSTPLLKKSKDMFREILGQVGSDLVVEGNYYYDVYNCGIGFHGDTERRKVIGVRVGASMRLRYVWFESSKPISRPVDVVLDHGDIYIMSDKAVGYDWKKKNTPTLRHSAGCGKFTNIPDG